MLHPPGMEAMTINGNIVPMVSLKDVSVARNTYALSASLC